MLFEKVSPLLISYIVKLIDLKFLFSSKTVSLINCILIESKKDKVKLECLK